MATKKKAARKRSGKAAAGSRGPAPAEAVMPPPEEVAQLGRAIQADGGALVGTYRDPLDGSWLLACVLPIDRVAPTPYQRDLSDTHVRRLADVIDRVGIFLDPIVATREREGLYWTPNGSHRLAAMRRLGVRSITALVVPDSAVATKILALNTEKAHSVKEKALEVIRMARALAEDGDRPESDFALEFEEPVLLTLGPCYERNGRFAGSAYRAPLLRVESFLDAPLPEALAIRERRAAALEELDARVSEIVDLLKARGIQSPYLRPFVVARINPLRFKKVSIDSPEELLERMQEEARRFDPQKIRPEQISAGGGFAGGEE